MSDFNKLRTIELLKEAQGAISALEKELDFIAKAINARQYKKTA